MGYVRNILGFFQVGGTEDAGRILSRNHVIVPVRSHSKGQVPVGKSRALTAVRMSGSRYRFVRPGRSR